MFANTTFTTTSQVSNGSNRESNPLPASIALHHGVGSNSTVTNWMFSNTTQEEEEAEEGDGDGKFSQLLCRFYACLLHFCLTEPIDRSTRKLHSLEISVKRSRINEDHRSSIIHYV